MKIKNSVKDMIMLPWETLKKWEFNSLKSTDDRDVSKLKKAILNGFNFPFYAWEGHEYIIDGTGRYKALCELESEGHSIKDLPVVFIQAESLEDAKRLVLECSSQHGVITQESFDSFINDMDMSDIIDLINLPDIALPGEEVVENIESEGDPDEAPEPPEDPETVLGDVYEIGSHRLVCGDSTQLGDVEKLMSGKKADILFTDPPYNINYCDEQNGRDRITRHRNDDKPVKSKHDKIQNDAMSDDDFIDFLQNVITNVLTVVKEDWAGYWWLSTSQMMQNITALEACGVKVGQFLVWVKNNHTLSYLKYQMKHEPCLFIGPSACVKPHGRWYGEHQTTVWEVSRESKTEHPTQKPVELAVRAIQHTTKKNEIVLDVFGGSGTTMVAAELEGRKAYLMELDPKYCDVIVNRMKKLFPTLKIKKNGKEIE